jgi:hypothetical protein
MTMPSENFHQRVEFVVLYRWRLHPGSEELFISAWSRISEVLLSRGSLGSRLHCSADGIWYSYAQWPSAQARTEAFTAENIDAEVKMQMQAAIAEQLPEIVLTPIVDYIVRSNDGLT